LKMKNAKVCKKGTVKIKGKCYPGIKTEKWTIVKMAGDLQIYRGTPSMETFRGSIMEGEENWQPASIQVSQDHMKHMEESNVAIFFDADDLKKKKWQNMDLPR